MVERTCVVCYSRFSKNELNRYVWRKNGPVADCRQVMDGRGGYCCNKPECSEQFFKSEKRLKRVFRLIKQISVVE